MVQIEDGSKRIQLRSLLKKHHPFNRVFT